MTDSTLESVVVGSEPIIASGEPSVEADARAEQLLKQIRNRVARVQRPALALQGRLTRVTGLTLEASGIQCAIGERCVIETSQADPIDAEVVGFAGDNVLLMPVEHTRGVAPYAPVRPANCEPQVPVGDSLFGRVLDGAGKPIDGKGPLHSIQLRPLHNAPPPPLSRRPIDTPLDTGVRVINALTTVARGQRVGLFAGSGVGKSSLLAMMTRYTQADVVVVGLIGERGREVEEFVRMTLGQNGIRKAIVIATPASDPPLLRAQGAILATSIAEHFRDRGKQVLLLMDSLTRFAQAQREIGLAIGEPPVSRGYPPSVFVRIPELVERAGNSMSAGSLTAIYTVLTEGDEETDPIADSVRAILDGHIVLSRRIAEAGQYPAVDVNASVSRLMPAVVDAQHLELAYRLRALLARYDDSREMVALGMYKPGTDPDLDEAIGKYPQISAFLRQSAAAPSAYEQSVADLRQLLETPLQAAPTAIGQDHA